VEKIFWGRLAIHEAASLFYFTKDSIIERLLHQLKYKGRKEVGTYCGRLMGAALQRVERFKDIDAIIPLPLFKRKERQRGFNQAKLLCDGLREMINKPIMDNVIVRTEATETQTHKNRIERWQNMESRFKVAQPELLKGKHVLLVDDVITTGATLESCAQELLQVERARLSILTFAYSSSRNV
jgi:ComF family protein